MKLPSRRAPYLVIAGALSILLGLTGAWSQTARTVKIVVPYPAGGTADILARILGEQISRTEGVTLLTENRPGASAVIGTEAVSRAAPDGSTLLITSTAFLIARHLRKLNYDPLTSFEPICQLVSASRTRSESLPSVPTVAESGFKGYEADNWNGLFAPAKTPNGTVSELAGWFAAAMQIPEVKAKLVAQSLYPAWMCGADFAALLSKQYNEFGRVIREANIKAD